MVPKHHCDGAKMERMSQTHVTVELLHSKREEIQRIAAKHGARNLRVFGSVARGDSRPDSDIDFLVDVDPVTSS
jgi:predicted nucleotidyltransferase